MCVFDVADVVCVVVDGVAVVVVFVGGVFTYGVDDCGGCCGVVATGIVGVTFAVVACAVGSVIVVVLLLLVLPMWLLMVCRRSRCRCVCALAVVYCA